MIKLTDFTNICRLCLRKHEQNFVDLFSKPRNAQQVTENELLVAEMVETFCSVKIRKGDGLPESICEHCWTVVSSIQSLQTVSLKSDRLLYDILNSHSWGSANQSSYITKFEIEFIDTASSVKKEPLAESETICSVKDLPPLEQLLKTEPSDATVNNKRSRRNCSVTDSPPIERTLRRTKRNGDTDKKRTYSKHGEKNSFCEICGKLVSTYVMDFHLNIHKDIRPFKCKADGCEKYFHSPGNSRQHYKKVHVNSITRPYKCDVCGSGFIQKSSLDLHRSYHFDPQLPCPICGKLFRNKRALQKHSLVHTGERNYPCSECKKSFQTSFTLRTHMRIHTLEKPYSCTECEKTFAYKCLLKAHTEKYHPVG